MGVWGRASLSLGELVMFGDLLKPPPKGSGRRGMPKVKQSISVSSTNSGLQSDQVSMAKPK